MQRTAPSETMSPVTYYDNCLRTSPGAIAQTIVYAIAQETAQSRLGGLSNSYCTNNSVIKPKILLNKGKKREGRLSLLFKVLANNIAK